jgi:hypothetical protein
MKINFIHHTPYNDNPYYELRYKNVSSRGKTKDQCFYNFRDCIERVFFEQGFDIDSDSFNFKLTRHKEYITLKLKISQYGVYLL